MMQCFSLNRIRDPEGRQSNDGDKGHHSGDCQPFLIANEITRNHSIEQVKN